MYTVTIKDTVSRNFIYADDIALLNQCKRDEKDQNNTHFIDLKDILGPANSS